MKRPHKHYGQQNLKKHWVNIQHKNVSGKTILLILFITI